MTTQLTTPNGNWTITYDREGGFNTILTVTDAAGQPIPDSVFSPFIDDAEAAIEEKEANAEIEALCARFDEYDADNEIGWLAASYGL